MMKARFSLCLLAFCLCTATMADEARTVNLGYKGKVTSVEFVGEGPTLTVATVRTKTKLQPQSVDVSLWDARSGKKIVDLGRIVTAYPEKAPRLTKAHLAVSPDGRYLAATGSSDWPSYFARKKPVRSTVIKVWDVGTRKLLATLNAKREGVDGLQFLPDSKTLLGVIGGERIDFWSAESWKKTRSLQTPVVQCFVTKKDIVTVRNSTITIWDRRTLEEVAELQTTSNFRRITYTAFSPAAERLAITGLLDDKTAPILEIWDLRERVQLWALKEPKTTSSVWDGPALSPDGRLAALTVAITGFARGDEGRITIWNLSSGKVVQSLQSGGFPTVPFLSTNGHVAAVEIFGGTRLWELSSGKLIGYWPEAWTIPPAFDHSCAKFSSDGSMFVEGGYLAQSWQGLLPSPVDYEAAFRIRRLPP